MISRVVPLDPEVFGGLVNASCELLEELRFEVGPETGVALSGMDPANVAFVEWRLGPEHFLALPSEPVVVDVKSDFGGAFKGFGKGSELEVVISEESVAVVGSRKGARVRRAFPRLSFEGSRAAPRNLSERLASSSVKASFVPEKILLAFGELSEEARVDFQALPEAFIVSERGDLPGGGTDVRLEPAERGEAVEGAGKGRYAVAYLRHAAAFFAKGVSLVSLAWTPGAPLFVFCEFPGVFVRVVVAPVVENE